MSLRADVAELFAGLSVPDREHLSTSARAHQRVGVVTRGKTERVPGVPKPRNPLRGKAQYAAIRADPTRWEAVKAASNAYRYARRVRKGHARKLDDAAIALVRSSAASTSALARQLGVSRRAIDYRRKG